MAKDKQINKNNKKKYTNKHYLKKNNYNKNGKNNNKNYNRHNKGNNDKKKILADDNYIDIKQKSNKIEKLVIQNNVTKSSNSNKKKVLSDIDNIDVKSKTTKVEKQPVVTKKSNKIFNENEIVLVKKKKNKYIFVLYLMFFICFLAIVLFATSLYSEIQKKIENNKIIRARQEIVEEIKNHYNEYVKVTKDTILYKKDENDTYYKYGVVYAETELMLDKIEINYLTEYFYSIDLDCYIKYLDLEPIDNLTVYNNRYKNYIVFNQNIITKDNFTLYDGENSNKVYSFENSMKFPIIIKNDNGKYYVEFNNRLFYVLKDDIKEIINVNNTKLKNASKVTTLCYHRIYDSNHKCNDLYICKSKSNFEREMKYLSDNNFFTLNMNEMYLYLTRKIQVPQKSVVLTFDDGTLFELGIEILEKYNLHGTGFIKTGTFSDYTVYESPNFELQSHTDKMHVAGTCPIERANQQGGGILCLKESTVLSDLKLSREKLNGAIALAYPFYDYNNRAIELVKKAGFKLAFIGANNVGGRAWPGINLYKVPRMTIWNTTSFDTFKGYVNN